MARERSTSVAEGLKEPHSVNLKVLRLSRPTFNLQYPLPSLSSNIENGSSLELLHHSSLSYPSQPSTPFPLGPLVTLPSSFENAYIGESFSCCLSANNSTPVDLTDVLISAEIETPSVTVPLDLVLPPEVDPEETALKAGDSFQRILRYDLKEEGKYVLAVTVTYTEPPKPNIPTPRSRTFRKLYQFVAQQCLMVRTKAGRLSNGNAVLEAQVENVGEAPVTLENINLLARNGWSPLPVGDNTKGSFLREKEVLQVAFYLLAEKGYVGDKTVLGQLEIEWRAMGGDKGQLTTGNLGIRRVPGS